MITMHTHEIKTIQYCVLDLHYFSNKLTKELSVARHWNKYWKINVLPPSMGQSIFLRVQCSNNGLERNICQWTHFENRLHAWFRFSQNKVNFSAAGMWLENCGVFQSQSVLKEKKGGEKCVIIRWFKNECLRNDSGACAGFEVKNWILPSGLLHSKKLWVCWQPQSELISNFSAHKIKHKRFL